MELNQILKLIDAGFTKADIEAMTTAAPAKEEPAAVETPAEEPVKVPAEEPVKVETPAQPTVNEAALNGLLDEVKSLRKQLQLHAILNDGFTPATEDAAEQILASIINPATSEKKGK